MCDVLCWASYGVLCGVLCGVTQAWTSFPAVLLSYDIPYSPYKADPLPLDVTVCAEESASGSGDEGGDEAEDGHPLSPGGRHNTVHSPRGLTLSAVPSGFSAGEGECSTLARHCAAVPPQKYDLGHF